MKSFVFRYFTTCIFFFICLFAFVLDRSLFYFIWRRASDAESVAIKKNTSLRIENLEMCVSRVASSHLEFVCLIVGIMCLCGFYVVV